MALQAREWGEHGSRCRRWGLIGQLQLGQDADSQVRPQLFWPAVIDRPGVHRVILAGRYRAISEGLRGVHSIRDTQEEGRMLRYFRQNLLNVLESCPFNETSDF